MSYYLIGLGYNVFGFDNLNDYYDVNLKKARLYSLKEMGHNKNDLLVVKEICKIIQRLKNSLRK